MRRKATIIILAAAILPAAAFGVPTYTTSFVRGMIGTTVAEQPELAGTVIEDRIVPFTVPTSDGLVASGRIQLRTIRGADRQLTFTWRIFSDRSSRVPVWRLEILDFPRRAYDADWRRDGAGTVAPTHISGEGTSADWRLKFNFTRPDAIFPGEGSRVFFLRTSARASRPARIRIWTGHAASATLSAAGPAF